MKLFWDDVVMMLLQINDAVRIIGLIREVH